MEFIVRVIEGKVYIADEASDTTAVITQQEFEAINNADNYEIVNGVLTKIVEPTPVSEPLAENEVRVKVVEGTVYLASDAEPNTAIITREDWESIDRTKEYAVANGNLIEYDDTPLTPQTPAKPSLETLYDADKCGFREQINALWLAIGTGDKSEYDKIEALRVAARNKHEAM